MDDPDIENEEQVEEQATPSLDDNGIDESDFNFKDMSFSPLQVGMFNAHELYHGARNAGFNSGQALYLVACAITGGPRPPLGTESGE